MNCRDFGCVAWNFALRHCNKMSLWSTRHSQFEILKQRLEKEQPTVERSLDMAGATRVLPEIQ